MAVFRIVSSQLLNRHFEKLCDQADSEGRGASAIDAAEEVMKELSDAPASVGELLYTLKNINLPVRHVVHRPWSIHFAIDEQRQIVYLSKIELLE
jgi:hypothetical protein